MDMDRLAHVKFLSAGRFVTLDNWKHIRRVLPHDVLLVGLRGKVHVGQGEHRYELALGGFVHLRAGVEHFGYEDDRDVSYYWVHFVQPADEPCDIPDFAPDIPMENSLLLFRQLLHFANREDNPGGLCDLVLNALLMEIKYECEHAASDNMGKKRDSAEMLEWIRIHIDRQITLEEIAREFHYSPKYLSELFKRKHGVGFSKYIMEQRLNKACSLLASTTLGVDAIARQSGFQDEKYFMRVFKAQMGVTPTAYRNSAANTHLNNR